MTRKYAFSTISSEMEISQILKVTQNKVEKDIYAAHLIRWWQNKPL